MLTEEEFFEDRGAAVFIAYWNVEKCTFRTRSVFSVYCIDGMILTEMECVYCAVRTGSLYIILRSDHTVYLCVLCGSENKERLFPYTALTDWFL